MVAKTPTYLKGALCNPTLALQFLPVLFAFCCCCCCCFVLSLNYIRLDWNARYKLTPLAMSYLQLVSNGCCLKSAEWSSLNWLQAFAAGTLREEKLEFEGCQLERGGTCVQLCYWFVIVDMLLCLLPSKFLSLPLSDLPQRHKSQASLSDHICVVNNLRCRK